MKVQVPFKQQLCSFDLCVWPCQCLLTARVNCWSIVTHHVHCTPFTSTSSVMFKCALFYSQHVRRGAKIINCTPRLCNVVLKAQCECCHTPPTLSLLPESSTQLSCSLLSWANSLLEYLYRLECQVWNEALHSCIIISIGLVQSCSTWYTNMEYCYPATSMKQTCSLIMN